MTATTKQIVVPVDGSENALTSLDYLDRLYGPQHDLEVNLVHVWSRLPPLLTDDKSMDRQIVIRLRNIEKENERRSERILAQARTVLVEKGFDENRIKTHYQRQENSVAQDICYLANRKKIDAVLLTRRGRIDLETFFFGGISGKLVNYCGDCPVWILGGKVNSDRVLVGLDDSETALRAAGHAGLMLSGTRCRVTLFHTIKHLRRYVSGEMLKEDEDLEQLWKHRAGEQIAPIMKTARDILLDAGLTEEQIRVKVLDGSKSAADDILKEARGHGYGTIVLGRHGRSMAKEFLFGSVPNQILHDCAGLAVWIVQ